MAQPSRGDAHSASDLSARDWAQTLIQYRRPKTSRAIFELFATVVPFIALWVLAWWSISISPFLAIAISFVNAAFLVRLFAIQHDCGHGSFLASSTASNWVGRCLGVVTLTPYAVWRKSHAHHHSTSGNLDHRGMGDVHTKTVTEYAACTPLERLWYRIYRSPLVLFGIGPIYLFVFQNRLPIGFMGSGVKYWISAMGTNLVLAIILGIIYYYGGILPLVLVFLPTVLFSAAAGVWLFYVQHQFEDAQWDHEENWNIQEASFRGSSHYKLPVILDWLTASIGVHHVHHLNCRIPFYRLQEVLGDHQPLANMQTITLWQSFNCARLHLWDENQRKLLSFAHAKALYGTA